ncbi:MAG: hypothetical protein Q9195_002006 [Heterodermia aff. obscurata]
MFVYMDGEYQCNRNRQDLEIPDEILSPRSAEVDFRVRQKEERQADGTFIGNQWKFRELEIVSNGSMNAAPSESFDVQSIGTIEVVVLRCYPMNEPTKTAFTHPVQNLTTSLKFRQRVPALIASPIASSSNESWSDDNRSQPGLGGLFDGTDADILREPGLMHFGGDASWDNTGQGWDNGQTWQQQSQSPQWNDVPTNNNISIPGQGQTTSGQWNNGSSHSLAMDQSVSRSRNGSKQSRRSSLTVDIPHASSPAAAWGSQQGAQPSTQSPAVVVNVIQPGATFVPSPAHPGWHPSRSSGDTQTLNTTALSPPVEKKSSKGSDNSGSEHSGSGSSSSNKNSVANNDNTNDNWQNTTSGAQDLDKNTQEIPKIPGAWAAQDNFSQVPSQWNDNGNNPNNWSAPSIQHQANQRANGQTRWDNGNYKNNNVGTDHAFQQNKWDNGARNGTGGWNSSWANNNDNNGPPQQIAGGTLPQQSTWENDNGTGNANGNGTMQWKQNEPDQGQNWGPGNDNGNAGIQSWNNSGNVQPASRKQYNSNPGMTSGFVPSATAEKPVFHHHLATGQPPMLPMPLQPKPYWSKWKAGPDPEPEPEVEAVEGPIHQVPRDIAQRHWMSHQVLLGKPAAYMHKTSKPKYIDTHQNPYAVFVFHYRSREILEKMLGIKITDSEQEEKDRLSSSADSQKMSSGHTDSSSVRVSSKDTVIHNDNGPADPGPGFGTLLANKLSKVAAKDDASSDKPTTNPELLWSRPVNHGLGISTRPNASTNDNVTGWLNKSGGEHGGSPPTGPPQAAWAPPNGGGQMNSPVGSPPQTNWSGNAGRRYTMSGGNGAGPSVGQAPNTASPWLGSNNGNGGQSGGSWTHNSNIGNRQGLSPNGSRKSSGNSYNNVPFEQHAASWNNSGGNGSGSQNGAGWTDGNGGTNIQADGSAPPASGW